MTASWKIDAERALLEPQTPAVLTTAMLHGIVTAGRIDPPSPATFARWVGDMAAAGKLQAVIKGVYLNRLGHGTASAAAAAHWIRRRSVVSLSWVLEQAGITNNFGDTITCVIPAEPGLPNPQIGDRKTAAGSFRFFLMPAALVDERAGPLADVRDLRFDYPRATPEKAFLDWIYLGASPRSRLTRPPMDLDVPRLNKARVKRLAKAMKLTSPLDEWMAQYQRYQQDEDVQENTARLRY